VLGLPVPARRAEALSKVGAIVEEPSFYPHLTGYENLKIAAAIRGPETRPRIGSVLDRVGLDKRGGDRVGTYSLGMRQRLGLASALLGDPELLLLDEPANGLDPAGVHWLRGFLRQFAARGRTVLISSHVLAEVAQTVDQALIIDRGRLIATVRLDELADGARSLEDLYLELTTKEAA
jgi:ABC-2 type transport system ATP-binding protein